MLQKGEEINTIVNLIVFVLVIMLFSISWLLFDLQTSWQDIYQGVFKIKPAQQQSDFKTIEIAIYDQAPENVSMLNAGLKKFTEGKIVLEILNVTNTTSKVIHKKIESSIIKETNNVDLTILLNLVAQKKDGKYYFENKEINIGNQLSVDFEDVFLNGTIQRVS